jgi:hypothetical protein
LPIGYALENPNGNRRAALQQLSITKDGSSVGIRQERIWRGWNTLSAEQVSESSLDLQPFTSALINKTELYTLRENGKDVLVTGGGSETRRLSHTGEVMFATFNADGNCVLTTSSFAAIASGDAPDDSDVVRLWDADSGTLLQQRRFHRGLGPLAAVFADRRHILVLFNGDGFVLQTPLCGPEDLLVQTARKRVLARQAEMNSGARRGSRNADAPNNQ